MAVLLLAVPAAGLLYLRYDDPAPSFKARRGRVAAVHSDGADVVDGHLLEAVTLRSSSGMPLSMLVKRPVQAGPAPLVLLLGGHVTGRDAARLIPDTQGRVVVALSYPYDGPHTFRGLELLPWIPKIRQAIIDTPPAIQLALDWLLQQPWVDPREVHGIGASLGTPFMVVAAARDPRITHLWSVHGAGRSRELLQHNSRAEVPGWLAPITGTIADILIAGPWLTPERWIAHVSPRPFTMLNARDDERLPRDAIEALYAAAGEPKSITWFPGGHVLRSRPEIVQALVKTVLDRMNADSEKPVTAD
jgi:dienelactone hydrolase